MSNYHEVDADLPGFSYYMMRSSLPKFIKITASVNSQYRWDRISKISESGFLRLLKKHLKYHGVLETNQIMRGVVSTAKQTFLNNKDFISDKPSQFHLLLTSYILSSVENLTRIMSEKDANRIVSECFKQNGGTWIKWSIKIALMFSRDKFCYLVKSCGEDVRQTYGDGFEIEVLTDNRTYLTTIVRKCGFHEFFKRNQKSHLTQLMCEWDSNWSEVIVNSYPQLSYERPKTIAAGCDCCEFKFVSKT